MKRYWGTCAGCWRRYYKDDSPLSFSLPRTEIAESLPGKKLKTVIEDYHIDTASCTVQNEPPGIARGIRVLMPDSAMLWIQIDRTVWDRKKRSLMNNKVTGIGVAYIDCSKKNIGEGFVWRGTFNPYCKAD